MSGDLRQALDDDSAVVRRLGEKLKKLSYMEQREWEQIEARIMEAEANLEAKNLSLSEPAVMADYTKLASVGREVADSQEMVDKLYKRSIKLLQSEMQADPEIVRPGTRYLFVLASLERVGDRAGNIAWHTKDMIGAE